MSTPLELRNWRKGAQRSLRLLFNGMVKALGEWKAGVAQGKILTTDIANLILEYRCIEKDAALMDSLPLDARSIFQSRYTMKLQRKLHSLRMIVETLANACASMSKALEDFKTILCDDESDTRLGDPRLDMAICTSLTFRQISLLFDDIVEKYQTELGIKQKILDDFCNDGQHDEAFYQVHITAWMTDVEIDSNRVQYVMRDIAVDAGMPYNNE